MKQNQYQRGAVGSFIIVAVILALVALTVLYGARQFMSQQSAPISTQDLAPQSGQQPAQTPGATKPHTDTPPAPQQSGNTQQQSTQPSSGATDRQAAAAPRANQSSSSSSSQHLPQTGPTSAVVSAAGLATLVTLALLYVRSRRLA